MARGARGVALRSAPAEERSFPWVQRHTTDELVDRIASVSFVARLDRAAREELLGAGARRGRRRCRSRSTFRYRTDVFVFARL